MVDKAHSKPQKGKAPLDQSGAGGSDSGIEVTPQMIEAGVRVLEESGRLSTDYVVPSDDLLVREILVAALRWRETR